MFRVPRMEGQRRTRGPGQSKSLKGANGSPLRHLSRNSPGEPYSPQGERDLMAEARSANIVLPEYRDGDLRGRALTVEPGSTETNRKRGRENGGPRETARVALLPKTLERRRRGSERVWGAGRGEVFEEFVAERQGSAPFPTGRLKARPCMCNLVPGSADKISDNGVFQSCRLQPILRLLKDGWSWKRCYHEIELTISDLLRPDHSRAMRSSLALACSAYFVREVAGDVPGTWVLGSCRRLRHSQTPPTVSSPSPLAPLRLVFATPPVGPVPVAGIPLPQRRAAGEKKVLHAEDFGVSPGLRAYHGGVDFHAADDVASSCSESCRQSPLYFLEARCIRSAVRLSPLDSLAALTSRPPGSPQRKPLENRDSPRKRHQRHHHSAHPHPTYPFSQPKPNRTPPPVATMSKYGVIVMGPAGAGKASKLPPPPPPAAARRPLSAA